MSSNIAGETNREHSTSRDIDGDGSIDVVHSNPATGPQIDYLNDNGDIVLTDVDSDSNGTFETAITTGDNNVTIRTTDVDDDGDMDTVRYIDSKTGVMFAQQNLADDANGTVAETLVDANGDGLTDIQLVDTDLDGTVDEVAVDTDQDGHANVIYHDVDGDGTLDYVAADTDNDAIMDTNFDVASLNDDHPDTVSDFDPFASDDPTGGATPDTDMVC